MSYKPHHSTAHASTPVTEPALGKGQVVNSTGGYVFAVDDWTRLDRFLVLGAEGGTYYASERKLTRENAAVVERLAADDATGPRLVARVVELSESGRAPKNEPALFALAIALKAGGLDTRRAAAAAVPRVARTGTHFLHLADMVNGLGGWGRGTKRAFARWFTEKSDADLAYQLVKYPSRDGWSMRDVARLAHPVGVNSDANRAIHWAVRGDLYEPPGHDVPVTDLLSAVMALRKDPTQSRAIAYIRDFGLPREAVPSELLTMPRVWEALLGGISYGGRSMPLGALVRNLATMTRVGLLSPHSHSLAVVQHRLSDGAGLARARLHPLSILSALRTYQSGRSARGSSTWTPVPGVVDALDGAFYAAFPGAESTGGRVMLALDVSSSMTWSEIAGTPGINPRVGSAAMAMVTAARETNPLVVGFTSGTYNGRYTQSGLSVLDISPRRRLDDVVRYIDSLPMGGTDCSLPVRYATDAGLAVDTFVVYTDNETNFGTHPFAALRTYRQRSGINARLVVVGMTSTGFSIADPSDAGMLDVVGFDAAAPALIADFARGS